MRKLIDSREMIVNFLTETALEGKGLIAPEILPLERVAVIILGGGEGKRLEPLTKARCKPAISFGGRYTLIDVPISHALSSGLRKVFVIGQYLASTLQKHLFQTYLHHGIMQEHIHLLVPEERKEGKVWYKGTADAVRQNLNYFADIAADYFLILSGDQLYNIHFQEMIRFGIETDADMVIAAQAVGEKEAKRMGLLKIKHGGSELVNFYEKPTDPAILRDYYTDDFTLHRIGFDPAQRKNYLGSMGIYFFKRQALFDLLREDKREDFGKHLIDTQMKKGGAHVYLYDGYWEDIGTIEAYYEANLALTRHGEDRKDRFRCYDEKNHIFTKSAHLPGAKILHSQVNASVICEGSVIEGGEISHSILGVRSVIKQGTVVRDSILLGNEYYERGPREVHEVTDRPHVGENCLISRAIIDENVTIGRGVKLINREGVSHYDSPHLCVRDGIIVVPRGTTLPDGFVF